MVKVVVAIFGAAGFVGRNLVNRLKEEDVEFVATDVVKSPFGKEVNYLKADILDPKAVREVVSNADMVVHLAASPLLTSLEEPRINMRINVEGTLNIMDASREFKIDKVIFSSASSVVGEVKYSPVDEEHPCTPKTPYAVAKKACEDYMRVYKELFDLDYLVFRLFNVYGPWQYPESRALIPLVYETLTQRKIFNIYGDGSATRDFIYVEDVADFFYQSIQKDLKNEIVNLGSGEATTILELVNLSSELLKVRSRLKYKPARLGEVSNFVANTSKLERLFQRRRSTSLEQGLKNTFGWLEKFSNGQSQQN